MTQKVKHGNLFPFGLFNAFLSPSHTCNGIFMAVCFYYYLIPESSSQEYREKKDKENGSSSESDNDDDGAAAGCGVNAQSSDSTKSSSEKSKMDFLKRYMEQLGLTIDAHNQVLKTVDFDGLIEHWNGHGFKKIITMVGAGISTCKFRKKILKMLEYFH